MFIADAALEQGTRERVLAMVSEFGPVSAVELAQRLHMTAAGVRRHLDALSDEHAIEVHEPILATGHRPRGRPARQFVVSETGHASLGAAYDTLATDAVRFLATVAGPDAVAQFARARATDLEARYAALLGDRALEDLAPSDRAAALVEALAADGYAASARPVSNGALTGIQLCQGHCPVHKVAEQFPQFCEAEADAFSRLLGVHVQRLATLAHGDHVCTTFIPTIATRPIRPASAGPTDHSKEGSTS